jgi:hypothetical protein
MLTAASEPDETALGRLWVALLPSIIAAILSDVRPATARSGSSFK